MLLKQNSVTYNGSNRHEIEALCGEQSHCVWMPHSDRFIILNDDGYDLVFGCGDTIERTQNGHFIKVNS